MLLIPMEARPTSRENLAAQTLHLEGEPQSSDLPGVLRGKEKGLGVEESSAHRAAGRSTPALCSSPGDCASVTSSTGRLPNKQAQGSGRGPDG